MHVCLRVGEALCVLCTSPGRAPGMATPLPFCTGATSCIAVACCSPSLSFGGVWRLRHAMCKTSPRRAASPEAEALRASSEMAAAVHGTLLHSGAALGADIASQDGRLLSAVTVSGDGVSVHDLDTQVSVLVASPGTLHVHRCSPPREQAPLAIAVTATATHRSWWRHSRWALRRSSSSPRR